LVEKRAITVKIAGVSYRMLTDADPTYLRTLASYVDDKLREAREMSQPAPTQKLTVLAAMNIADELFQERQKRGRIERQVRGSSRRLLTLLERAERSLDDAT
jgi:cell division protein ZapA